MNNHTPKGWEQFAITERETAEWERKVQDVEAGLIEPAFINDPTDPTGPKILNPRRGQLTEKGQRKAGLRSVQ
jgi:hypothetical protein